MIYPTFASMEAKLKDDLDLNEETFIQDDEMQGYFNEAVSMIQHQIHTLAEDYLLAQEVIPVTAGDDNFQLPANIYANKIRKIQWLLNESEKYEILPIKNLNDIPWIDSQDPYQYILLNNGVTNINTIGTVAKVYPAFRSTSSSALTVYYIRSANKYENATSVCDIPEWSNVIIQYVRYKCMVKEGHPNADREKGDLDILIKNMNEALASRTMDENNRLALDSRTLSSYLDYNNSYWDYWF